MQVKAHSIKTLKEYLDSKAIDSEGVDTSTPDSGESTENEIVIHGEPMPMEEQEVSALQSELWPEEVGVNNSHSGANDTALTDASTDGQIQQLQDQLYQAQLALREYEDQDFQEPYKKIFRRLAASGVSNNHASVLIRRAEEKLQSHGNATVQSISKLIQLEISQILQDYEPFSKKPQSGPRMITLIGGTGVGKTTTLMKIASKEVLKPGQKLALISLDRYRMGGNTELDLFSKITSTPIYKPRKEEDLAALKQELEQYDLVITDTPGRNMNDQNYLNEIRKFINVLNPSDILLTTSLNADPDDIYTHYASYMELKPTGLIFTKLDETARMGKMITLAAKFGLPIAYVCDGQDVTGNLHLANSSEIWDDLIHTIEQDEYD